MVAIGGSRPVDGGLFYTNTSYEHVLLDVRTRMLETQSIRTRQSYLSVVQNYGNLDLEMASETAAQVTTPKSNGTYAMDVDTPLFLETMRADVDKYIGLVAVGSTAGIINYGTNQSDLLQSLWVGATVEIDGEERQVQGYTAPTATAPGQITLSTALSAQPDIGSMIVIKGRDYVNPHFSETYRVTDRYGSYISDVDAISPGNQNELTRFQVDRQYGLVRYRPAIGAGASSGAFTAADLTNSIWHPATELDVPYYFGKMIPVQTPPTPAAPLGHGIPGVENLGEIADPNGMENVTDITTLTSFGLSVPDGEYSNIRIVAPPGISIEVELNGAKLAIAHNGGELFIPFYDPNFENDNLKANEQIDPDLYIQRFIKAGNNHLVIKATETAIKDVNGNITGSNSGGNRGIRVQGFFNGVNLETGAVASNVADPYNSLNMKPHSAVSVRTLDWSASRNSILGIVGKIDFDIGDRILQEDINDEVNKSLGVLESLTTIIAGTDINAFQSLLSILR